MRKTENKKLVRLTDQYIQNVNDLLKRKQRRKRKCERSAIKKVTMNEERDRRKGERISVSFTTESNEERENVNY